MSDKHVIDWEAIRNDYRAGIKTLRQMGEEHGVTHGAINKRAKRDEWVRDLKAKIQAKAEEKVSKAAVSKEVSTQRLVTETQIVEANAELQFRIRMEHRSDITRSRSLFQKLLAELEAETDHLDLFAALGELMDTSGPDKTGNWRQDKLNELYKKVISQSGRIDNAKKLIEILEKVVKIERQAFNISDGESEKSGAEELLSALGAKLRLIEAEEAGQ